MSLVWPNHPPSDDNVGFGILPEIRRDCINGSGGALAIGQIVVLDTKRQTATTFADPGASTSVFAVVDNVDSADIDHAIFGVCMNAAAIGEKVEVVLQSWNVDALQDGSVSPGTKCAAQASGTNVGLETNSTTGSKIIAITLEQVTADTLGAVMFSGIASLGTSL